MALVLVLVLVCAFAFFLKATEEGEEVGVDRGDEVDEVEAGDVGAGVKVSATKSELGEAVVVVVGGSFIAGSSSQGTADGGGGERGG